MDERLKRLIARREQAAKAREQLLAQRKAIVDLAEEEAREDLSVEEDTEFRALTDKVAEKDTELRSFDERISELSEEMTRDKQISEGAAAVRRARERVQVTESATYYKGSQRSYFRDLMRDTMRMDDSGESGERLRRHAFDVQNQPEYRDLTRTDTAGGYAIPPLWLMADYAELARAGRPTANLVNNQALPGGTDSINVPKLSTGTTTAIQTADNAAVSETDLADTAVTANVKTIAGQQDLAIQLLDQSPINFDQIVFRDLVGDYATKLNVQVLSGSNGSGQVKGILGSGGNAITYTDTSPTVAEFYSKLAEAVSSVHTNRFRSPSVIVMHPRRWAWLLAATDTQGRPLVVPSGPGQNQIASFSAVASQQVVGNMQGLPVVTDPSIPITLGSGNNEDRVLVMKADDHILWESSIRTRVLPDVGSGSLTVRLQVYGYLAFTAEVYPLSTSIIAGSGLVAPTF